MSEKINVVRLKQYLDNQDARQVIGLLHETFPNNPNLSWAESIILRALSGQALNLPYLTQNSFDRISAWNLYNNLALVSWESLGVDKERFRYALISPKFDDVYGANNGPDYWNWMLAPAMNFALLPAIKSSKKAAVVVCMRDDGIYIIDWVAHYRAIGFEHIFVYSNDNLDGSEWLLRRLSELQLITYIENDTSGTVSPQRKGFEHSIHSLPELRDYEWVLYADSDEYFIPSAEYDYNVRNVINAVESKYSGTMPDAVIYNWKWYGSCRRFAWDSRTILERFQHSIAHKGYKSLVRISNALSMRPLHHPETAMSPFFVDSALSPIERQSLWSEPCYNGGSISHFWTRSFEEFAVKKRRGEAFSPNSPNDYARDFVDFFNGNCDETAQNYDPPPASVVKKVKIEAASIRALPGVASLAGALVDNFPKLVAQLYEGDQIARLYNLHLGV